jgi:hypothetical protein
MAGKPRKPLSSWRVAGPVCDVSGQLHAPTALPPGTHWVGWVSPRAGVDAVKKEESLVPAGTPTPWPPGP